ncbi:MAG: hypothetical protein IJN57_04535 [Oscillospiraceae bacterium]|nr:hypothetical protein [Oscillospiraceae bacterium]
MYESTRCKVLNRDVMKYLALVPMFIGHMIGWITMMRHPENSMGTYTLPLPLQIVVDLALFCPPVMFFMIVDGYKYTKDRKKYALRLLLFACITQPFHWLLFQPSSGWWTFNVIFTLFFGLLSIIAWESGRKLWQRILLVILCALATAVMMCDWIIFGVLFIFFLHVFRDRPKARLIAYTSLLLVHTLLNLFSLGTVPTGRLLVNMLVMFVVLMAPYFCMTTFYNGKKGAHPVFAKWFFYAFYPLHYLVIFIVKLVLDHMQ